jgi:hypothetical protein
MAMAFTPICIEKGIIVIEDPNVVSKSYPDFWSDLDDAVEIDIEEIKTSAPSVGIEIYEPKIYSEEQDKKNGTKPTEK